MIRLFTNEMALSNYNHIFKKYNNQYQNFYPDVYLLYENNERQYSENLKSEKFIIDIFCKTFFGFTIFKKYKK